VRTLVVSDLHLGAAPHTDALRRPGPLSDGEQPEVVVDAIREVLNKLPSQ